MIRKYGRRHIRENRDNFNLITERIFGTLLRGRGGLTEWLRSSPGKRVRCNSPAGSSPVSSAKEMKKTPFGVFFISLTYNKGHGTRTRKGQTVRWTVCVRARLSRAQDGGSPIGDMRKSRVLRHDTKKRPEWVSFYDCRYFAR